MPAEDNADLPARFQDLSCGSNSATLDDIPPRISTAPPRMPLSRARMKARPQTSSQESRRDSVSCSTIAGESSRTSLNWNETAISLAKNVQDNLLEEVFKLQTALESAQHKHAAAISQVDLLQRDHQTANESLEYQRQGMHPSSRTIRSENS